MRRASNCSARCGRRVDRAGAIRIGEHLLCPGILVSCQILAGRGRLRGRRTRRRRARARRRDRAGDLEIVAGVLLWREAIEQIAAVVVERGLGEASEQLIPC